MVQHGKGDDKFLSKKFEEKRRRGLEDKEKIDSSLRSWYGISGNLGGGLTDSDTYERKQNPYPVKGEGIRSKKTIDIRDLPWIG